MLSKGGYQSSSNICSIVNGYFKGKFKDKLAFSAFKFTCFKALL
ncbi:hypothetical protein CY0110_16137 [Crocosphaera chwakensis CCY0110]|uniref:Uncharacterized protein n=1 Tax=Crocosphaera chwakensis CCY0110 TaxID=391612 RepID=A3IHQ9_9CHRO|nr:hypothetical protein CY0110_16137 [Crocosphaera chwakensis CCY0110]